MIVGIDARGLNNQKAGISTYIEEVVKKFNFNRDSNITYILYSNKEINISSGLNDKIILKTCKKPLGSFWIYFCLPRILKEDKVDVFWGTQHCLPMRNKHTKNIKFLLTVHDLAIHKLKTVGSWKNTIVQKLFFKKSCKNADKIIAVSKATKKDIIQIMGIDKKKIKVIYEATNFSSEYMLTKEQEYKIKKKYNIQSNNYLFFLSTIEPRKNLDTAIKAFEKYKEEKNDDLKFLISGGVGWKCKGTLDMIENSKYKEDIIRTGYITKEEKEYFFKNCKAFLYPSLYEGFGLPILEAMQKGALVITSNVSSIPEVGGDIPFYLNNVHDEMELKVLIEKVLTLDEKTKNTIIYKGYEQVKKFNWSDCAQEILKLMLELKISK